MGEGLKRAFAAAKATRAKLWWIMERHNPQLGIYYVPCGQLSKTEARKREGTTYGHNVMHAFPTEEAYLVRLKELRAAGESVHR